MDASFKPEIGPNLGAANYVTVAALQPDGRILIGGKFSTVGGAARNQLARLNSDGSLDASFNPEGGPDVPPSIILVLPDGRILIAGSFSSFGGVDRAGLARLNTDGSLDATFDPGSGVSGVCDKLCLRTVAVQPDEKIIVGGRFTAFNGTTGISGIVRLNPDGSLDNTFNTGSGALGSGYSGTVFSVVVQSDRKIVVVGGFNTFNGAARRGIARLNPDGSLDNGFDPDFEIPSVVATMAVQSDGKPVIAVAQALVNGIPRSSIARLNEDGSLDQSFNAGNSLDTTPLFVVAKPDGKVLIGHYLNDSHGPSGQKIARLNIDGTLDNSFSASTNTFISLSALVSQPNGKVLVAGKFKGVAESGIIRLNEDGSIDTNFIRGLGTAGTVSSVALQADEKILVGGTFSRFNGVGRTNLVRLNADGTLDSGFIAAGITNINQTVGSISLEPDGKILVVTFNNHLVRLNPNGSADNSFASPLTFVGALAIGRDGRIYAAGVTNNPRSDDYVRNVFRLNPDGSVDSRFIPVVTGRLYSVALEPDELSLLLAGDFLSVNGVLRTSLARVFTVPQPSLSFAGNGGGSYRFLLTGESARTYRIDTSTNLVDWFTLGTALLTNSAQSFIDSNAANFKRRFYRAVLVP